MSFTSWNLKGKMLDSHFDFDSGYFHLRAAPMVGNPIELNLVIKLDDIVAVTSDFKVVNNIDADNEANGHDYREIAIYTKARSFQLFNVTLKKEEDIVCEFMRFLSKK
jgi:hypothetical protein